ncbi:multiple epidermal growth factor-like domains protein 11 [Haliotis asinina]|uniref:multiple epidermal growth factor-like domains protein 11 n=1 Tax=Haliotis asinina TaxID=109174 RepID=UPI0035325848
MYKTQHFKTSLSILCLTFTVQITRATQCANGQHCPVCDNNGDCSKPCDAGYFGTKCMSDCSSRCRDQLCELTDGGIEICTKGCVPGYMGTSCKIPCDKPGTQCAVCEGGCDGGYCRFGSSSCVSGCVDSYYGLDCKNCSERCKSCNRSTGMCNDCLDPYRGLNCEMSCENCEGSCVSRCDGGCKPGFYGHWCDKVCSENCRPGPDKPVPECDSNTGDCVHGCDDGWYGKNCYSRCSRKCADMSCNESGSCAAGCAPGSAGTDCSCLEKCFENVCFRNETCAKGCINGYYGAFCNKSCDACLDGICEQTHGTCTRGCNITDQGCTSDCTNDCPLNVCLQVGTCPEITDESHPLFPITIGALTACLLCLTGVIVAMRIAFYKRIEREEADAVEEDPPADDGEAHDYDLVDVEPDRTESGPVIVFLQ